QAVAPDVQQVITIRCDKRTTADQRGVAEGFCQSLRLLIFPVLIQRDVHVLGELGEKEIPLPVYGARPMQPDGIDLIAGRDRLRPPGISSLQVPDFFLEVGVSALDVPLAIWSRLDVV